MFIFERETDVSGEGQREKETQSEAGSRLWAVSTEPDAGLELMNREIMTWAEVRCSTNWATQVPLLSSFFFHVFYLFLGQRESMNGGGAEREGDTESEAGSRLWTVSTEPDAGLELMNREIMTWAEVRCLTDWATQVPLFILIHSPWNYNRTTKNLSWVVGR